MTYARRIRVANEDNDWLTVNDIVRAGVRRSARRREAIAAEEIWDSEGGRSEPAAVAPSRFWWT